MFISTWCPWSKMSNLKTIEFKNGIKVILNENKSINGANGGIFLKAGSRNDKIEGCAHFIEHMIFRGNEVLDCKGISVELDKLGANVNAFTSHDFTCYYGHSLGENLSKMMKILVDMVIKSKFDEEDIDKERSIINEEISMYEDDPEDHILDLFSEIIFKDKRDIGHNILGTRESIKKINRDVIKEFYKDNFTGKNILVSISGNYDETSVLESLRPLEALPTGEFFDFFSYGREVPRTDYKSDNFLEFIERKDLNQYNFLLGFKSLSKQSKDRHLFQMFNSIFGGKSSSILWQKIREEMGLCYTISSFGSSYYDEGYWVISGGTSKENLLKFFTTLKGIFTEFLNGYITPEILEDTKNNIKSSILLGLDQNNSIMMKNAVDTMYENQINEAQDIRSKIENVTMEDFLRFSKDMLKIEDSNVIIIGPKKLKNVEEYLKNEYFKS